MKLITENEGTLKGNLKKLTDENESLKAKFSKLLDQFQDYVNECEKKIEEDA